MVILLLGYSGHGLLLGYTCGCVHLQEYKKLCQKLTKNKATIVKKQEKVTFAILVLSPPPLLSPLPSSLLSLPLSSPFSSSSLSPPPFLSPFLPPSSSLLLSHFPSLLILLHHYHCNLYAAAQVYPRQASQVKEARQNRSERLTGAAESRITCL